MSSTRRRSSRRAPDCHAAAARARPHDGLPEALGRLHGHPDEPVGDDDPGRLRSRRRSSPTTFLVAGSMRETVPSPAFATQTAPAPTATATGSSPTGICTRGVRARVDPRHDVVSAARDPNGAVAVGDPGRPAAHVGAADRAGQERGRIEAVDGRVAGADDPDRCRRPRRPRSAWSPANVALHRAPTSGRCGPASQSPKTAHTPLGPAATAPTDDRSLVAATSNVSCAAELGIDPRDLPGQAVRDPDVTVAERHPGRRRVERDGVDDLPGGGIDARQGLAVQVGRPDRAAAGSDRPGPDPGRDLRRRPRSTSDR